MHMTRSKHGRQMILTYLSNTGSVRTWPGTRVR